MPSPTNQMCVCVFFLARKFSYYIPYKSISNFFDFKFSFFSKALLILIVRKRIRRTTAMPNVKNKGKGTKKKKDMISNEKNRSSRLNKSRIGNEEEVSKKIEKINKMIVVSKETKIVFGEKKTLNDISNGESCSEEMTSSKHDDVNNKHCQFLNHSKNYCHNVNTNDDSQDRKDVVPGMKRKKKHKKFRKRKD